jgi:DDE superfamily endonuclease
VLRHILRRKETAVLDTLPRAGERLQSVRGASAAPRPPDPAQVADAVGRFLALREFRTRLYGCLTARPDALFELCDAILCADHAVTSLVQLSLESSFTRGHGALYDALAEGRIDEEQFAALLTATLPSLADGEQARAWAAEHDVIDYGLLEAAIAGLPDEQAAQVREACARWRRLRFAIDATPYPRPDAECSPGREHVHHDACRCDGARKTIPGWEYQFAAAVGHLRTAWTAVIDVERTAKAARTSQTARQVKNLLRRLRTAGHAGDGAPLVICDAGYSAAALTAALAGHGVHLLVRLPSGSVLYGDPVTWPGKRGRPCRHGTPVTCCNDPAAPGPEPEESLILPDTPHYGTVRVDAWRGVHPIVHGDRGWFKDNWHSELPILRGTLLRVLVDHLPGGRPPRKTMWLWHAGPAPLSADELWRAYLARFDEEHTFRFLKGSLGLTAARVRTPEQADRWVRLVIAACAQLLIARPLAADLRRPWEKPPDPGRPLSPGRVRRGFPNIRRQIGTPAHVAKPGRPGPGRPKGSASGPAPRHPITKKSRTKNKPDSTAGKPKVKT